MDKDTGHVTKLRGLVLDALEKQLFDTAVYCATALVSMTGASEDYYRLAQSFFIDKSVSKSFSYFGKSKFDS